MMTLSEVKEKLGSIVGTGPDQVDVHMAPKEGNSFILTVQMANVGDLSTGILVALLDLGRDSGMELSISPLSDEHLQVVFRKDPVEVSL